MGALIGLLLAEAEQGVLVVAGISDWHVGEGSCKPFEDLLLSLLDQKQLHVAANGIASTLIYADQVAPFACGVDAIIHDLTISEFGFLFKDFLWGSSVVDVCVVHVLLANDTKLVLTNPPPESDWLVDFTLLDLCFGVQIENLDDRLCTLSCPQSNDVLAPVHQDALSLHRFPLESKVLRRIDDGTISCILDTNVLLTLKSDLTKLEKIWRQSKICELEDFLEVEWEILLHFQWRVFPTFIKDMIFC